MTRRRAAAAMRAGAVAVVTAALLGFLFTPSADAADAPEVSIDSPGPGAVFDQPGATISGRASMHQVATLETNSVTRVTVTLSSSVHPGPLPTCDPCNHGQGFSVPFSWTTPPLRWNGPYSFTVVARGIEAVEINGEESTSATRSFSVAVPPSTPKNVEATANPDRTVTVSWARNTEPDLIGYRVQRKDPGSDAWVDAGELATGSSLDDRVPADGPGGAYSYRVQAIRPGASGGRDTALASGFAGVDANVLTPDGQPAPPGGDDAPGTNPAAGPPGVPAGSPPDLKGFLGRGGGGGPRSSDPSLPKLPGTPDSGFSMDLPYGAKRRGAAGAVQTMAMGAAGLASNPRALAVPVAAGLVLGMASFHLRLLSRRMDEAELVRH